MTILNATYRFTRADTIEGFFRTNSAGTDALEALGRWCGGHAGRFFSVQEDTNDVLVANVVFDDGDQSQARDDMQRLCVECGVQRDMVDL